MMTPRFCFGWQRLFSIVHTAPAVPAAQCACPSQPLVNDAGRRRDREAGQAIIEFALIFSLFLLLILGGIDMAWDVNQKSNFNYVVTQAATCVATYNCDPNSLSRATAGGLGLIPANLNLTVAGSKVTATYQGVSLTHFLPAITFNSTITATCVGCLNQPPPSR